MKRALIHMWVSVLTFCLGVSASSVWRIYSLPKMPAPIKVSEAAVLADGTAVPPIDYMDGIHACGPNGSFHAFRIADGSRVSVSCFKYSSPSAVRQALKRWLAKGKMIKVPEDDVELAGRIIVAVPDGFEELRTYRYGLCVTEAPSLSHLRMRNW